MASEATKSDKLLGEVEEQATPNANCSQMNQGRGEQPEFAFGETWGVEPIWLLGPSQRRSFPILMASCHIIIWQYVRLSII